MSTALDLSQEQWSSYKGAKLPAIQSDHERWQRGWQVAYFLAHLLREQFGATQVAVFGSLSNREDFDIYSDLDLIVWGIHPTRFYQAVAAVTAVSNEFEVDLVDGDTPPLHLSKSLSGALAI
ncbi:nucleotidyltransferase [Aphanothece hegewaldii CCALA 016]|uniref:Nucleotidyltransferase n=1 Tax=Aphanothece hegewaldii CCALA 016 TaxID=2107694 RepID=A0A2T1LQE8_9CHRO|nr:nucleotidyltransferase domain-containing protein [Aphanothece hegewaldii]PSF27682.1 nucleotidyltransferase [Aphanothece hegewaldii CCALA 016]